MDDGSDFKKKQRIIDVLSSITNVHPKDLDVLSLRIFDFNPEDYEAFIQFARNKPINRETGEVYEDARVVFLSYLSKKGDSFLPMLFGLAWFGPMAAELNGEDLPPALFSSQPFYRINDNYTILAGGLKVLGLKPDSLPASTKTLLRVKGVYGYHDNPFTHDVSAVGNNEVAKARKEKEQRELALSNEMVKSWIPAIAYIHGLIIGLPTFKIADDFAPEAFVDNEGNGQIAELKDSFDIVQEEEWKLSTLFHYFDIGMRENHWRELTDSLKKMEIFEQFVSYLVQSYREYLETNYPEFVIPEDFREHVLQIINGLAAFSMNIISKRNTLLAQTVVTYFERIFPSSLEDAQAVENYEAQVKALNAALPGFPADLIRPIKKENGNETILKPTFNAKILDTETSLELNEDQIIAMVVEAYPYDKRALKGGILEELKQAIRAALADEGNFAAVRKIVNNRIIFSDYLSAGNSLIVLGYIVTSGKSPLGGIIIYRDYALNEVRVSFVEPTRLQSELIREINTAGQKGIDTMAEENVKEYRAATIEGETQERIEYSKFAFRELLFGNFQGQDTFDTLRSLLLEWIAPLLNNSAIKKDFIFFIEGLIVNNQDVILTQNRREREMIKNSARIIAYRVYDYLTMASNATEKDFLVFTQDALTAINNEVSRLSVGDETWAVDSSTADKRWKGQFDGRIQMVQIYCQQDPTKKKLLIAFTQHYHR